MTQHQPGSGASGSSARTPDSSGAAFRRLRALLQQGIEFQNRNQLSDARRSYERALQVDPNSFDALQLLGVVRFRSGDFPGGIALLQRALDQHPAHAPTLNNLGNALRGAGDLHAAIATYRRALHHFGGSHALALRNLGSALLDAGEHAEAALHLHKALELAPGDAVLWCWIGHLRRGLGENPGAIQAYERALDLDPSLVEAQRGLGSVFRDSGNDARAAAAYEQVLEQSPDNLRCRVSLAEVNLGLAAWADWESQVAMIVRASPQAAHGANPFSLSFLTEDPEAARKYADAAAAAALAATEVLPARAHPLPGADGRIRLAYITPDVRDHPVAWLIAGVLENHEPSRFDVRVYALGPEEDSPIRARIASAAGRFIALANPTHRELAMRIAADQTDLLVDLAGYTKGGRPAVLAARPAAVQINWLGYPGTFGGSLADYLITDEFATPPGSDGHYAENLVRLPDTFMPCDRTRAVGKPASRSSYGLPEDAVVLCSFSQVRKINPALFACWMTVLQQRREAVLWLRHESEMTVANLRREAAARAVAPDRLVFAPWAASRAEYLARYCVADVALDTFPYGSHSTAPDALWAGCPLVALAGRSFASRVSGSVVRAAGVPELVAHSAAQYQTLIDSLIRNRALRLGLRSQLEQLRSSSALFDIRRFLGNLECAYATMHARAQRGLPAMSFNI
jgi:protein O-GlcNAc transferase